MVEYVQIIYQRLLREIKTIKREAPTRGIFQEHHHSREGEMS